MLKKEISNANIRRNPGCQNSQQYFSRVEPPCVDYKRFQNPICILRPSLCATTELPFQQQAWTFDGSWVTDARLPIMPRDLRYFRTTSTIRFSNPDSSLVANWLASTSYPNCNSRTFTAVEWMAIKVISLWPATFLPIPCRSVHAYKIHRKIIKLSQAIRANIQTQVQSRR